MSPAARVRLVIHFDKENGFDSSVTLPRDDAEKIAKVYWDAIERRFGKSKRP